MINKSIFALALGAVTLTAMPALAPEASAQTRAEQRRFDVAQQRFERERRFFEREREIYENARRRSGSYRPGPGYQDGGYTPGPRGYDERYVTDYDASRYYRDDPRYTERRLSSNDEVYRGSDGRYYCKRSDGTTGLIVGAAAGGVLGNVIDGGRNRAAGTLIGGALGALLGKSVEQNQQDVRCR